MGLTLATKLTIIRILAIPIYILCVLQDYPEVALLIFVIAAVTDALDGFIARTKNQKTELGTILDPLADKLLLTTAFLLLAIKYSPLVWVAVIVISRDVLLTLGTVIAYMLLGNVRIAPNWLGKITTTVQLVTVLTILLIDGFSQVAVTSHPLVWYLCYTTAALTIISGLIYIIQGSKWLTEANQKEEEKRKKEEKESPPSSEGR
ncbi:MAG: CDP-diacylglycerol--glycerol-3-phosphate 3-phosphatidyltransferase [bacterium]|nr:CDP-diacylglycerol--glycerol-3-phosphate 3-phosphatidyltransferase [bacterium]